MECVYVGGKKETFNTAHRQPSWYNLGAASSPWESSLCEDSTNLKSTEQSCHLVHIHTPNHSRHLLCSRGALSYSWPFLPKTPNPQAPALRDICQLGDCFFILTDYSKLTTTHSLPVSIQQNLHGSLWNSTSFCDRRKLCIKKIH